MRDFKATRFRRTFGCSRSQAVVIHHQLCPTLEFKDVLAFLRWAKTYPPNYRFPGFTDRTGSIKRIWKIANVIAQNAPAYWSTTYPNVRTYPYNLAAWAVDGIHFQLPRSTKRSVRKQLYSWKHRRPGLLCQLVYNPFCRKIVDICGRPWCL